MIIKDNLTGKVIEVSEVAPPKPELTPAQKEQRYKDMVVSLIRERYTGDDENALLRKKLAGLDEAEFDEYNTFAESCKTKAREALGYED